MLMIQRIYSRVFECHSFANSQIARIMTLSKQLGQQDDDANGGEASENMAAAIAKQLGSPAKGRRKPRGPVKDLEDDGAHIPGASL
jgi:hypothetical protein